MAGVNSGTDVTVVIVSYNTRDHLRACLESLDDDLEVIVVDNGSKDGTLEILTEFPRVRVLENEANRGFGSANNQGIELASNDLVLLLNSDAKATPGAVRELAKAFEDPGVVAAGGKLLNPDGSLQQSTANHLTLWAVFCEQYYLEKVFPNSALFSPYWTTRKAAAQNDACVRVGQVMGACLMMRKVERFDERFFLYCEDTELCRRLEKHGQIVYCPGVEFFHALGASSLTNRWRSVAMYNAGKELYFRIHHGPFASAVACVLDRTGALLRLIAWTLRTMITAGTDYRAREHAYMFLHVLFAPSTYNGLVKKK